MVVVVMVTLKGLKTRKQVHCVMSRQVPLYHALSLSVTGDFI